MSTRTALAPIVAMLVGLALGIGLGSRLERPVRDQFVVRSPLAIPVPEDLRSWTTELGVREDGAPKESAEIRRAAGLASASPPGPTGGPSPVANEERLLLELLALCRSGEQVELNGAVKMLVETYLQRGDPRAAFLALETYGYSHAHLHQSVGRALREAGDEANATIAFQRTLTLDPGGWGAIDALLELNPSLAVEVLREASCRAGDRVSSRTIRNLVHSLNATGDSAGAYQLLQEALVRDADDWILLDLLEELNPLEAERRLRDLVTDTGDPTWYEELAELLAMEGRVEEASNLLLGRLANDPDHELIDTLIGISPILALEHLSATVPAGRVNQEDADRWENLAERFLDDQDRERAAEAYCRAILAEEEDPESHVYHLNALAPARLIPVLEQRARLEPNAAVFGSLADSYWESGRREDALEAWERAHELAPEVGWSRRIADARAGRDPVDW